ncbi:type II toxin-antitoxin system death-on-curing family toxin [Paenibacillus sp. RC67]|uniref:type II toxin-antitoxin system death-on-curing family toxin n=1 Tax=Paenibacillus sp. RC67 TaxID=3039392 RepID=UPI0024AD14C4|nr:type II toxin-antitoxin system death-on-curing family toxin [Paenibacillus sp. RC67]
MNTFRYLSSQEVIAIHVAMIQRYSPGEHIGVKSNNLLESAVQRPMSSAFGDDAYPTVFEKAAALFESLGQNHPFQYANKRTAFTALVIYLRYNDYVFTMETMKAEDFNVDMVNHHKYSYTELVEIIRGHAHKVRT